MAYTITDKCISCERCLPNCPTHAIESDGSIFWINADRCNQCQGSYRVPQCWAACPTNGGIQRSNASVFTLSSAIERSTDYWKAWFATYQHRVARLKESQQSDYWKAWFESYSQTLQHLKAHSKKDPHLPLTP